LSAVTRRVLPLAAAGLAACAGIATAALTQSPGVPVVRGAAKVTLSRPDPTPQNNVDSAAITVTGRAGAVSPAFTG